jgi:hypothetical protein
MNIASFYDKNRNVNHNTELKRENMNSVDISLPQKNK